MSEKPGQVEGVGHPPLGSNRESDFPKFRRGHGVGVLLYQNLESVSRRSVDTEGVAREVFGESISFRS
jgi:hypothetical protein